MLKIKRLPDSAIAKIAAGEVIESPASAIKEMIENSLDANSTVIKIELDEAELKSIKISDDGDGIEKEDFPLLCRRYATSKIERYEDIQVF